MVIDKIGNINNIVEPKGSKSVSRSRELKKNDKVEISAEAKHAAETARYVKIVKDTNDTARMERVREIKAQIKDGTYDKFDNDKVLEMVADRIASYLIKK
jgi:anti-sigma28 factor (negative regulator of flagellin synthesis)